MIRVVFFLLSIMSLVSLQAQPKYDIIVAQDGTGQFTTVQEAVLSVRDFSPERVTIFIKKGEYKEKLIIPIQKTKIALVGEDQQATVISWDDYSGKGDINTYTSHTVLVQGAEFSAENLTFANTAGPVGQAVALHVEGDKVVIRNCRIIGNQDTLFPASDSGRQYYEDCYIEGTTDFIFGPSTVVFKNCHIHSKKNSYVTAASTPESKNFGFVFLNCKLTADPEFKKIYLGRPWRNYAKTVFINCEMDDHILPEGWHNWKKPEAEQTTLYAEYNSTGPGANPAKRVAWSKQLTEKDIKKYTLANIFSASDEWNPVSAKGKKRK